MIYRLEPLGDTGIMIEFSEEVSDDVTAIILQFTNYLDRVKPDWMIEYIPSFTTVALFYKPEKIRASNGFHPFDIVKREVENLLALLPDEEISKPSTIEIPVCYGGKFGPDLSFVANFNECSESDIIRLHTQMTYTVHALGFAPGFPYLSGMPNELSAPRKDSPPLSIPSRSVGIAGKQTGIYPIETPGGWQIIGRTPQQLFRPKNHPPTLLQAGDLVRFTPIDADEYKRMEEQA